MKTISKFNNKGGVSKTTSVMFMAEAIATAGFPVLMIDNDSQGTLSVDTYDIPKNSVGMAEILINPERIEEALNETRVKDLWIIPTGIDLEKVAMELESRDLLRSKFRLVMDIIREKYSSAFDVCIIDNPPRFHGISLVSSEYADKIVIPVQSEAASFKAALRTYIQMKTSFPFWGKQDISVLVTRHNKTRNAANSYLDSFRRWADYERLSHEQLNPGAPLKLKVLETVILDSAEVENIKMDKANLFLKRSKSELAKSYIAATEEILPEFIGLGNRIANIVEERKKENFDKNIRPNAFTKKEDILTEQN